MLNATLIEALGLQVADLLETTDERAKTVTLGEMADGSRRHYALVDTFDEAGLEQQYRVSTPATDPDAPAWAVARYGTEAFLVEVRVGESWLALGLEPEPAAADQPTEWINDGPDCYCTEPGCTERLVYGSCPVHDTDEPASTTIYCACETPVMDVEHDAGCRRCGRPVDFSPTRADRLERLGRSLAEPERLVADGRGGWVAGDHGPAT